MKDARLCASDQKPGGVRLSRRRGAADLRRRLANRFYGDAQIVLTPALLDRRFALTIGVINVFNQDPPPCGTCTGPNYNPTTYDVPGQFGYLRISYCL